MNRSDDIIDVLTELAVFQGLSREELIQFADKSRRVAFNNGDVLIHEGTIESAIYIVTEGELKVFLPQEIKGREERRMSQVLLNVLNKGNCFGEYSLIDNKPTSASVMATKPGELIKIQGIDFQDILNQNERIAKTVYKNMLQILVRRLRRKDSELDMIMVIG